VTAAKPVWNRYKTSFADEKLNALEESSYQLYLVMPQKFIIFLSFY